MNDLNVTIIQSELAYENPLQNRTNFSDKIDKINDKTDIIILPEMFTTSFTMNTDLAESMDGKTIQWMLRKADHMNAILIGSLIIKENDKCFNRLIVAFPNGTLKKYDKRHLVPIFGEDKALHAGSGRLVFDYKGWKICPLTCYDLRFPVWSRNTVNFDLLIYIANWPLPRFKAWDVLLQARAIENVSYVAGVNRVGLDKDNQKYFGHSGVFDPLGQEIISIEEDKEEIQTVELNKNHLINNRKNLPFLEGKDNFTIKGISFPEFK